MNDDLFPDEDDAEECAILFGERYNLPRAALLNEPLALVEATARWHIRGDADTEALSWLSELTRWQRVSSDRIARMAAVMIEREFLPCVEALVCSNRIPTLPA